MLTPTQQHRNNRKHNKTGISKHMGMRTVAHLCINPDVLTIMTTNNVSLEEAIRIYVSRNNR